MSSWFSDIESKYEKMFDSDSDVNYDEQYLDKFVSLDPTDAGRFAFRGWIIMMGSEDFHKPLEDINKAIELDPENPDWYNLRAFIYIFDLENYKNAIADYTKAIELDPENPNRYEYRARRYPRTYEYEKEAINDYTKAIELDPENPDRYDSRARYYSRTYKYEKEAIDDYTKAIELDPENPNRYISRADYYTEKNGYEKEAINDYTKAIELDPNEARYYAQRGDRYLRKVFLTANKKSIGCGTEDLSIPLRADMDSAISDYTKAIDLAPEKAVFYAKRAGAFYIKKEYEQAFEDSQRGIEIDPKVGDSYFIRALYHKKMGNNKESYKDFYKAIELSKSLAVYYIFIHYLYEETHDYQEVVKLYDYFDWDEFGYCYISINPSDYTNLDIDDESNRIMAAAGSSYFYLGNYEAAVRLLMDVYYSVRFLFDSEPPFLENKYIDPVLAWEKLSEDRVLSAKIEERNRIIADLSHSIKNLIATVIDPLQQLKQSPNPQPQIIDNAIRGANLIREIANAMNLSFKGSVEDFRYDARHNDSEDAMSIQRMVVEALKYSAGNMFDGKYFEKFMRKYFPSREEYTRARADWSEATENNALPDITTALSAHFFEPDISLDDAQAFVLGNERGSAVKLMILFQEMIFNAVKYAAFVPRQERFVRVQFYQEENDVVFWVENAYDPSVRVKTTGLGHVIIKNFAAILGTEPVIHTEANRYSVMIRFSNLWQEEPS